MISLEQHNRLLATNPQEARRLWEAGEVELSFEVRQAVENNRQEPRPIGFQDASDHVAHQADLARRDARTAQGGEEQGEEGIVLTHEQWSKLSETDPDAAREAHREGRVDFPEHIAAQLQANRSAPRIGG